MRLEQLEYFVAVVQNASVSEAAKKLGVSQPAISMSLQRFEDELGAALLKRGNRGVTLTAYGEKVYGEALQALNIISGMYAKHSVTLLSGEVHILTQPICSSHITRNILVPFGKRYPDIHVLVHNVPQQNIIAQLKSGKSNMAVTMEGIGLKLREEAQSMDWAVTLLFTDERRIFIGSSHPLAEKEALSPDDLKSLPLAFYSINNDTISRNYRPYFGKEYRLANRNDILDLVLRNEAAFIQAYHMFKQDYRMQNHMMVGKPFPLADMDSSAPIIGIHTPALTPVERMVWEYIRKNFTQNI